MRQPPYDPADLLKLHLYGHINQVRSSRRLEREACRIRLPKNLRPGRTIFNVRKENWAALKAANRSFVLPVRELGLVGGRLVAIDDSFLQGQHLHAREAYRKIFTRKRYARKAGFGDGGLRSIPLSKRRAEAREPSLLATIRRFAHRLLQY